jgi:exodeoxyribonuclease VII small subunit
MSSKDKSVTEKLAKLTELVAWFESDDFVLEEAISHFKDAEKLANEIEADLSGLKNEITVLKKKFDEE